MSLVGVMMLLSFPCRSGHDFHQHLRTARIRRSIVSHTFVSAASEVTAETVSRSPARPTGFLPVDLALALAVPATHALPAPVPAVSRILRLARSGRSRASGDDPLI
jgi:hypothetical protein